MSVPKSVRNEIVDLVRVAWNASVITQNLVLEYDNVRDDNAPTPTATGVAPAYGRVSVRHGSGSQRTVGQSNRFERLGIVTVQLFAPQGEGFDNQLDDMIEVVLAAFEGQRTASGAFFFNVGPVDVGPDGPWFNSNVSAEFTYDTIR